MRRMRSRPAGGGVIVGLALALAGCGIPSDGSATLAGPDDVPFDLLMPAPASQDPTPTTVAGVPRAGATVFMVQGERLAPVGRDVPAPVAPESALEALAAGPSRSEQSLGLRTALIGDEVMRSVSVSNGIATVDLGPAFVDIVGRDVIVALAQIVATLTGLAGVGQVRFTLEGVPVGVPRGDGSITSDPVSFEAYGIFAPVPLG